MSELRKVAVTPGLFEALAERVDWGEPDSEGFYTPTLYAYGPTPAEVLERLTDAEALSVLARHGRILAIVIPKGIATERVLALKAEVDAKLEALVAERGPLA